MSREGVAVPRFTVERLIRRLGLSGIRRDEVFRTTTPDANAPSSLDRGNQQLKPERSNQLWMSTLPSSQRGDVVAIHGNRG